ncbi:MAG: hypothetical protein ABSE39_10940 [Candidatus Bathyarchaeia archaeon]
MTSSVLLNFFPVVKYPTILQRVRIENPIETAELNASLRFAQPVHYHVHGTEIFFAGSAETVHSHLKASNINFNIEEPISISLRDHFDVLRIILYKAFRYFAQRKGYAWKPYHQTVLFASNIANGDQQRIKNEFNFEFVHVLMGYGQARLHVHEGFTFKLERIDQDLFMVILPNVTPLLAINTDRLHPNMNIAPVCHKLDCEVRASCKLAQKKVRLVTFDLTKEKPWWCPYAEATILAKDVSGKTYWLPAHTIHLEANPHMIRQTGAFKEFRAVALKNNQWKLQSLRAMLSHLANGGSRIIVPVGDDPEGFQIDCELKQTEVEVQNDAWKNAIVA